MDKCCGCEHHTLGGCKLGFVAYCEKPIYSRDIQQLQAKNKRLKEAMEKHRWIPVSERLPKNIATVWVLLYAKAVDSLTPSMGFYGEDENGWGWEILGPGILNEVTHWKPIILPDQALQMEKPNE